jgi:hypothetical protein
MKVYSACPFCERDTSLRWVFGLKPTYCPACLVRRLVAWLDKHLFTVRW